MANIINIIEGRNTIEIYDDGYAAILISGGHRALIDLDDLGKCILYIWTNNSSKRPMARNSQLGSLHYYIPGVNATTHTVVPRNGDYLDCRRANLIVTSKYEEHVPTNNSALITIESVPTTSCNIIHTDKGYSVFFEYNGQTYDLDRYDSEEEARQAIYNKISAIYRELDPLGLYNL